MANLITIARFPVLVAAVLLLYTAAPLTRLISVVLLVVLIGLDTLDGVVARARNETTLMGSVLDIMADRAVELVLWVCYADLRLIPVAIPIVFVLRGTIVDSLRSITVSVGNAPFKGMRSRTGAWLVGSPLMRTTYGLSKFVSFTGLALTHVLGAYAAQPGSHVSGESVRSLLAVFAVTSWVAVGLCLLRGLPVVIEALPSPGTYQGTRRSTMR